MGDITILMLTLNKLPKGWQEYHKKFLLEAAEDNPIITISKEPMDWGENIIQTEAPSVSNIYWQILKGARLAKTPYVGIAEDDTLYPKEHFQYKPLKNFAYNMTRWAMFTWDAPYYFYKPRPANGTLIAKREPLIKTLEKEFMKWGNLPNKSVKSLILDDYETFYTYEGIVCLNHKYAIDPLEKHWCKAAGPVRALEIPKWGRAEELRKKFI